LCQLTSYELAAYSEIGERIRFRYRFEPFSFASPPNWQRRWLRQAYRHRKKPAASVTCESLTTGWRCRKPFGFGYTLKLGECSRQDNKPAMVEIQCRETIVSQAGLSSLKMQPVSNYERTNSENRTTSSKTIDDLYLDKASIAAPPASS
jgi:hypothetical protein